MNHKNNNGHDVEKPKESLGTRLRRKLKSVVSNDAEQAWDKLLTEGSHNDEEHLTEHERTLIKAALKLDTVTVEEVSVSRSEMVTIPHDATFAQAVDVFQTSRRTLLPVLGEHLDDVLGIIGLKDIVAYIGKEKNFTVNDCMRPAVFLPENMTLDKGLQHLKKQRSHIAIIVDEYGGTAGLATLKDILEELVGDLDDEDNQNDPRPPEAVNETTYKVDPRWLLEELRNQFRWPEPLDDDENFETVGGYVLALAGRIPEAGESITGAYGETFHITQTDGRKVLALEMTLPA